MPHLIIEYADALEDSLDPVELMQSVEYSAQQSGLFESSAIKTRALAYRYHQQGGGQSHFVHVTARILEGRSEAQKAQLSECILQGLGALRLRDTSLTVEICDMHRASYGKYITPA